MSPTAAEPLTQANISYPTCRWGNSAVNLTSVNTDYKERKKTKKSFSTTFTGSHKYLKTNPPVFPFWILGTIYYVVLNKQTTVNIHKWKWILKYEKHQINSQTDQPLKGLYFYDQAIDLQLLLK